MLNHKITNYSEKPNIVDEELVFQRLENNFSKSNIKQGLSNYNQLLNEFYQIEKSNFKRSYPNQRISVSLNALTSFVDKFVFRKLVENIFYNLEQQQPGLTNGLAVYIFGSVARNASPVKSDIDYFVVSNQKNNKAQDSADLICAHIQKGLADIGIIFDDSHMSTTINDMELLKKISDEEKQYLIETGVLLPTTLDSYSFNSKYYSFSQIAKQHDLPEGLSDKIYAVWRDTHDYIQLFLDDELGLNEKSFSNFHDDVNAFTAIADSWNVISNGCKFAEWRSSDFKVFVENNKSKIQRQLISSYNSFDRDRNNYDAYQAYFFIHFESTSSYERLSKMKKLQTYQKTEILQEVFQEGLTKLLGVIKQEFAIQIPEGVLLQIQNYFNIKLVHFSKEMQSKDLCNAAIDINSGLCDILLFALGQFPFKPLQQVVQEITKKEYTQYLDYKYFEQRMMFYYTKYNKKYLQEFLSGRNYFVPFKEYHELFVAHILAYEAGVNTFHRLKEQLIEEIVAKNKEFFNRGFLFVLKEDAQRISDILDWLLKTEFITEDNVFIIEGLSLGFRKKIINESEYLLVKNFKRLIIFMRYYSDLSSRAPLNAAAFKQLLFGFIDIHDLERVLNLSSVEIEKLSVESFTERFKESYKNVLNIYMRTVRKLQG